MNPISVNLNNNTIKKQPIKTKPSIDSGYHPLNHFKFMMLLYWRWTRDLPTYFSKSKRYRISPFPVDDDETSWRQKNEEDDQAWANNLAHVVSQWSQCCTNAMVGSRSWIGALLSRSSKNRQNDKILNFCMSPLQEQRLQRLQERLQVPFDETRLDHQEALRALWRASFPDIELKGLISEQWKDMGWQGPNPSTDFRGCGFISLENLLFFARTYPVTLQTMLDLCSAKPKCLPGINFIKLLSEDEEAFDVLYCIAFEMMDAQWLAMRASYMEFNEVLQVTRTQLERELSLEDIHRIQDLPAYNLLYQ
ncbi:hypothetical protein MKW98_025877 [Papaver atlanticum]|uniref:ELMO domain-containing protein n=1 Tax=Papaver atlanticum TaxID=357466 RepID=A0AAD4X2Z5_9MAGN|nr:hypothetical protein MKW98_025877 [Papaver atlanticum]